MSFDNVEWEDSDFEVKLTEMNVDASGSIPITWCLSPKVLEWVYQNGNNAWVLLATTSMTPSGEVTEWRSYTKLKDMLAYVTFHRPGHCKVVAMLTTDKDKVKRWMLRSEGKWKHQTFQYPMSDVDSDDEVKEWEYKFSRNLWVLLNEPTYNPFGTLDVELPKDCFAGEPPAWEKIWVNFLWRNKAVDQCEYRRRRMFAYTLQIIPFALLLALRAAILLLSLCFGVYNWSWKPLYSPIFNSTFDICPEKTKSIFLYPFKSKEFRTVVALLLPLALWGSAVAVIVYKYWMLPLLLAAAIVTVLVIAFVIPIVFKLKIVRGFFGAIFGVLDHVISRMIDSIAERKQEQLRAEHEAMLCTHATTITRLRDLPKKKRTIKLAFYGLKSQICKPYAK